MLQAAVVTFPAARHGGSMPMHNPCKSSNSALCLLSGYFQSVCHLSTQRMHVDCSAARGIPVFACATRVAFYQGSAGRLPSRRPLAAGNPDEWDRMFRVNVMAPMRLVRQLAPKMCDKVGRAGARQACTDPAGPAVQDSRPGRPLLPAQHSDPAATSVYIPCLCCSCMLCHALP